MNDLIDHRLSYAVKMKVRGKLSTKREIVDWGSTKVMAFIMFVDFFTKEGKFDCSISQVATAQMRGESEPFWDEFLERIETIPGKDGGTTMQFRLRLTSFARNVLSWLKSNPHELTQEMMVIMEKNPRLAWAVSAFKVVTTEMGVQVIERNNLETTDAGLANQVPKTSNVDTPALKFEQAKMNMLTMLLAISKSIPAAELRKMTVKDRMAAFNQLLNTATKIMGQTKPNSVIFQQINVNKAGRDELEKVALSYSESQEI